jgi:hypothetical protein
MREVRSAYNILVVVHEEKKPVGRPRRRFEDNIKTDLKGMGCEFVG